MLLGLMAVVTFVNVVLRYVFNASLLWGLEVTVILFAWLVIFGTQLRGQENHPSRRRRAHQHDGRSGAAQGDAVRRRVLPGLRLLMMKGAWDYWAPFRGLTDRGAGSRGRRHPRLPDWLRFLEPILN